MQNYFCLSNNYTPKPIHLSKLSHQQPLNTEMMMKRLIPFLLLLLTITLNAQRPENVITLGKVGAPSTTESRLMMCNDAGTVTFGPDTHVGASNDIGAQTVYLCFGDQILIDHDANTESLAGDPDPSTPGGVGYIFYECPPTVMGDNLAAIRNDDCVYQNPFFTDENGVILSSISEDSIWMATGMPNPDGDILFVNNGNLQNGFNGGQPVSFWFAPITYDALDGSQPVYEDDPSGPCVNVNTDEAFEVVYLNEIRATNVNPNAGVNGCQGAFRILGGYPEFAGGDYTSIDIRLEGNPNITADIESGPATHNENVVFRVPRPGTYEITVTDEKACPLIFTMDMSSCTGVTLNASSSSGQPGQQICLPVTVADFDSIQTFQFSMNWDADIVQFDSISNIHPEIFNNGGLETGDMAIAVNDGILTVNWLINNFNIPGVFLSDGDILFELCYTLTGEDGECSNINFSNSPTTFEASTINDIVLGLIPTNGLLCISDNPVVASVVPDSTSCNGDTDGGFTVTILGDNPSFRFEWVGIDDPTITGLLIIDENGGMASASGMPAGLYSYTVTDSSVPASVDMGTFVIEEPGLLGANISFVEPLCFGDSTAVITANVLINNVTVANTDGYTFNWAPSGNEQVLTNQPAGFYSVTITDPNGCQVQDNENVSDRPPLTLSITVNNATCSGSEDGMISVTPEGGTTADGTYHFDWCGLIPPGQFGSQTLNNLNPGRYCLVVTDDNGCQNRDTILVGADKLLVATVANYTPPTCNGDCDAELSIVATTMGTPPAGAWTYSWSNAMGPINSMDGGANNNTSSVTGLCDGTIRLIMTDSDPAGCELDTTFVIEEPELLAVDSVNTIAVTCMGGGDDGAATIFASGGTGTYSYTNTTQGGAAQASSVFTNLTPGVYEIEVTDANSCTTMVEVTIGSPTPPMVSIETDSLDCASDANGSLTAEITPGSAPIQSIMWSNGSNNETISGLMPGEYIVTITANDACATIDTGYVVAPLPLMTDSLVGVSPDCPGFTNGSATIFASGGTMPYTFAWDTGGSSALLPALAAGDYTVTVTDANNCEELVETVTVAEPDSIIVGFMAIDSVTCNGGVPCDGAATVLASMSDGSNQLFNIMWESGESASDVTELRATELCQGWQTVTVTDTDICAVVDSVLIPAPEVLKIDSGQTFSVPVTCNGDTNGSATVVATGGTAPYNYLWDFDGSTASMISNVPPGEQSVVITDAHGCTFTHTIEIGEPDPFILTLDLDNTQDVTCNGDSDGVIVVMTQGGNALGAEPFTWIPASGNPSSPIAEDLPAGDYTVIAEDILGCSDTITTTISEPTPLTASIPEVPQPDCFGFQTFVTVDDITGGNGPLYTFSIGVEQIVGEAIPIFVNGLQEDITITLRDVMGCETDTTITVTQPQEVQVVLPDLIEVQLGDSIRLNPTLIHDLPLASSLWTPSTALSSDTIANPFIRPFESEEYTLTITDINGCVGSDDVFIDVDKNRNVYIPNAFTPNADGFNDEFRVYTGPGVKEINFVQVFDRWGELVFSAGDDGPMQPNANGVGRWDGTVNNKVMNPGVFVYLIEVVFEDDVTLLYRGDVTIMQ